MNITRENTSALEFSLRIDVEEPDYLEAVEKELKDYKKKAVIPGFRKGMAPMGMINRMYREPVTADKVQNQMNDSLYKYIFDEKLDIVGAPMLNSEKTGTIDFASGKTFSFFFDCALAPEVAIDWTKITTKINNVTVNDEMVDEQVEHMAMQHGKFETPEEITDGCYIYGRAVEVDAEGKEVEGGKNTFCSFEMKELKSDEARAMFVGKKKEDKVVVDVANTFTTEVIEKMFHIEAAEAEAFKANAEITISGCSLITPHAIDEELFNMAFPGKDIKDEKAFREALKEDIKKMYDEQCEILYANAVRKELVANFDAEMPEAFLKRFFLSREESLTAEQLDADWAEKYLPSLKWEFTVGALNKMAPLDPTREEMVEECKRLINLNGVNDEAADDKEKEESTQRLVNSILSDQKTSQQISDRLYHNKLVALFRDQAKPKVKKVTKSAFEDLVKKSNEEK